MLQISHVNATGILLHLLESIQKVTVGPYHRAIRLDKSGLVEAGVTEGTSAMELMSGSPMCWSRFFRRPLVGDTSGYADIERRVAPIIVSIFSDAIDLLLRRAPQHWESTEGIIVGRTDLSESIRYSGLWT